jgi:peptide/nickel transport system permease protein
MNINSEILEDAPSRQTTKLAGGLYPERQSRIFRRLKRDRAAVFGFIIVLVFVTLAVLAPFIAPHNPAAQHLNERLISPNLIFPLGTDNLGRCLLSRLLFGAQISLGSAIIASLLSLGIGVIAGVLSGYFGGWVDTVFMRIVDLILAFPLLVLALAITGMIGIGMISVLIGIVSVWWASYARIVRSLVLSVRERPFIEAARATGVSPFKIITRHVLPNVITPVIVLATLEMGNLILAVAGLSFLNLGVQSPTPEWGAMLNEGRLFLRRAPQLMIYPGLMISLTVLGFNLLGDGLRDALDPRQK